MHKSIIQLLLKYDILKVIPMQESFFQVSTLTKKVRLSPELIQLNYEKLSPIVNPAILSYKEENVIYLWFLKKQQLNEKILIPESFLIYKALRNKQDGIFIFKTVPKQIYVIKEKRLQAAFVSYDAVDSMNISIIKDEYSLTNVVMLDEKEHDKALQSELQRLTLQELLAFMQFKMDKENLKKFFVQKLTYPLVSLLFIYMFMSYTQGYFMQKKADILTQEYQTLKTKNSDVKNAIRKHNQEVDKLEQFVKTEFVPVEPFKVTYDLYKIIKSEDKATVSFFAVTNGIVKIKIKTNDNAIKYLKRFNAIAYLKDVVIENTFKQRDGYKIHTYTMKIKATHE
ncbi:hypothetical protein [Sulfurimonas autotrophica]|uniref:Fimbrial assembly family protein n=1 Tax=Sulfurimonas autotrophica (strain ATCC BAA-671 / DSM 16294 / JCM 11897 / OK10) TaxID=563040 RepID=E0UU13_SULAO|nr:hypothetical protein [Sulfurimonas autotrophica]ADN08322.1 hypothetical protein Saut_0273 [Sulfurimonas autotrophica DSM 16294]